VQLIPAFPTDQSPWAEGPQNGPYILYPALDRRKWTLPTTKCGLASSHKSKRPRVIRDFILYCGRAHIQDPWLHKLFLTIAPLSFAPENDRFLLRARIAQELRRIIDRVVLNRDRQILVVLKPASGYGAEMEFRNGRFEGLRLTHLDSGEETKIDRLLFLEMQRYMLSPT
jgi:hypothetical protein